MKKLLPTLLALLLFCLALPCASAADVTPSPQKLSVDGTDVDCFDGSDSFKLRGLAYLLSEMNSRFLVGAEDGNSALTIAFGNVENEGMQSGSALERRKVLISRPPDLINDGTAESLSIYNIRWNDCIKLRDFGKMLGFSVYFDTDSNTAVVLGGENGATYQNAFETLLDSVNEKRRTDMASEVTFDGFEDYLQHHRALHYSYGAYYYFGEENFQKAEDSIRTKLSSYQRITRDQLISLIYSRLRFVRDGHFCIAGQNEPAFESDVRYLYYYSDRSFGEDANGYYLLGESEKWYYASCENANAEMRPYLADNGRVCYALRQFCPKTEAHRKDTVVLTNGSRTKDLSFSWTLGEPYLVSSSQVPDYHYLKENGIALVTIRNFDQDYESTLQEFVRTGADLRDAELIIVDARSNGGGSDYFIKDWLKNYTGEEPEQKTIISNWGTAMYKGSGVGSKLGEEFAAFKTGDKDYELFQGKVLENSTPILLLTDSMSGSSGESIVTYCRTLDNCLVIGGSTRGAQLVGNVRGWTLPNSGIGFQFGQAFHFIYNMENVDGKGYEPDLWCNPKTALQSVLNMVERYDLGSAEGVAALRAQLPEILK